MKYETEAERESYEQKLWEFMTFMKDDWSSGDDGDLKQTSSTICTSANQMYWAGSESGIVLAGR